MMMRHRPDRIAAAILLLCIAAVALSAGEPATDAPDPSSIDVRIFRYLNGALANPVFDATMPIITDLDRWKIVLLVIWAMLVFFGGMRGRWASLVLILLIVASDQLSSSVFKPLFARVRPCEVLGGVHLWYGPEGWMTTPLDVMRSYKSSFSCPSSHAANITAGMLFLGLVYRRLIWPLMTIAILVSFSRIYIGVHWPSDVAFGMVLGGALAWAAYILYKRLERSAREHEERKRAEREEAAGGEPGLD